MNKTRLQKEKSQIDKILDLLLIREDEGVLLEELRKITACHKSKLTEIRKRGYDYKILDADTPNHRYVLTKKPSEDFKVDRRKAHDILLESITNELGKKTSNKVREIIERHNFKIHRSNSLKRFAKE